MTNLVEHYKHFLHEGLKRSLRILKSKSSTPKNDANIYHKELRRMDFRDTISQIKYGLELKPKERLNYQIQQAPTTTGNWINYKKLSKAIKQKYSKRNKKFDQTLNKSNVLGFHTPEQPGGMIDRILKMVHPKNEIEKDENEVSDSIHHVGWADDPYNYEKHYDYAMNRIYNPSARHYKYSPLKPKNAIKWRRYFKK